MTDIRISFLQIGIASEERSKVLQGIGYRVQEMLFTLEPTPVAICTEHLQGTQENEMRERGAPSRLIYDLTIYDV